MNDVKWIKLTTTMFDDEKIRIIESMPDRDALLIIWFKLLTLAGKNNAGGYIFLTENIPYTDEMLSTIFNRPLATVRLALQTFAKMGMVTLHENGMLEIANWSKHQNQDALDKIRESTRLRVQRHRRKALKAGNVTVALRNALDKKEEKNIYSDFFETCWAAYPKRNGKKLGKAEAAKALLSLNGASHDNIIKAINNYATYCEKHDTFPKDMCRFLRKEAWREWIDTPTEDKRPADYFYTAKGE